PCRLRHGRLRAAAAGDRPGPRRRAALYRAHHVGRGRRALGFLQRAGGRGGTRGDSHRYGKAPRRGPALRPHDDQDHARPGVVDVHRPGHRIRGPGPGHLHADAGFPARLRGLRGQGKARVPGRLNMADTSYRDWPFFGDDHRRFAGDLEHWTDESLGVIDHVDVDAACRALVADLGAGGWLRHAAVNPGGGDALDVRTLCLAREILARRDSLADFAFAMQGLGSGAISLAGSDSQKRRWLPAVRSGRAIAAFALTEARSGSDVAAIDTTARRED